MTMLASLPVVLGEHWIVFDRSESYRAEVLGFERGNRVRIRRVCPAGVYATPTLAPRTLFTNQQGGYLLVKESP